MITRRRDNSINVKEGQLGSLRKQLEERAKRVQLNQTKHEVPVVRHKGAEAPATVAQQGLWVANELSGNVAFTVPVLHSIEGPLNAAILDKALVRMLERHVALRTTFRDTSGTLMQVLEATPSSVLKQRSLEDSKPELRAVQAESIVAAEIAMAFDLTKESPFRATLITLEPERHKLLLTIHHIACDQWSMGVFASELDEIYRALLAGSDPDLQKLGVDYLQIGVTQAFRESETGLAHFVEKARGKPTLRFVPDKQRPVRSSYSGDERAVWLGKTRTLEIRACARELGVSPFIITLAAFLVLARTQSGDEEFVFGTSSAGRESEEVAGLVGFFVNTLVLAASVPGDATFADLALQLKETFSVALEHSETPFGEVVRQLGVSGDGTGNSLTAVLFQQDNTPDSAFQFEQCRTTLDDNVSSHSAKYELLVSVRGQADDTRIHIQFDSDLFTTSRIEAMLSSMDRCLQVACSSPRLQVKDLPIISPVEEELLRTINATSENFRGPNTLHELVMAQANHSPDAHAIMLPSGNSVTYGCLIDQASNAAAGLSKDGVGVGDTVMVVLPPGEPYMVACLATLMVGAAFVPVAPDTPADRLDQIRLRAVPAAEVHAAADVERLVSEGNDFAFSIPSVDPDSRAYVIFTSGSTGEPKGVQVRHRGIVNNLKDLINRLALDSNDRCLAVSSAGFDMSIFEGFGILSCGGASIVLDPDFRLDPTHWVERAEAERATIWNSAPALLSAFLDEIGQDAGLDLPPLRVATLGGDWVPLSMPGRWWSIFPEASFDVFGGATESSIHSTYTRVHQVEPTWNSIPYGRPMSNQKTIVVDEFGRNCPVGVPGRLLLGGVGLADGYLNAPKQTAEAFTTQRDGSLWYDTGDVARWNSDLTLELLGRRDFLIKLNGLRIEPGDVEAALLRSGQVSAAVVFVRADPDEKLLAVVESEQRPDVQVIRQRLATELPTYMIPVEYHWVSAMPLNLNGKLDRRQVEKEISSETLLTSSAGQLPLETDRERSIASVWSTVLGVEVASAADDFFSLGGDSFKAVKAARLVDPLLPTVALFRYPTVRELARHIDQQTPDTKESRLVRLSTAKEPELRLVCVPYGGGNAVSYQPLADQFSDAVEVLSLNLPGHDLSDDTELQPISEVASQVVEELRGLPEIPTVIYAQCAGCATADRLARAMRRENVRLDAVFVGAALPDQDPKASMVLVRDSEDALLLGHIRGLGGFEGALDNADMNRILRVVRHDLQEMVNMYLNDLGSAPVPLNIPVHCVVGEDDPATEGYETRYRDWERLGTPVSLSVLPTGDHYFCATEPAALASLIRSRLGFRSV